MRVGLEEAKEALKEIIRVDGTYVLEIGDSSKPWFMKLD
jgi:hypothetical protein